MEFFFLSLRIDFHHAVRHVSNRTGKVKSQGMTLTETAEADSLDTAFHDHVIAFHIQKNTLLRQ